MVNPLPVVDIRDLYGLVTRIRVRSYLPIFEVELDEQKTQPLIEKGRWARLKVLRCCVEIFGEDLTDWCLDTSSEKAIARLAASYSVPPVNQLTLIGKNDSSRVQAEPTKQPVGNDMFITELTFGCANPAYETSARIAGKLNKCLTTEVLNFSGRASERAVRVDRHRTLPQPN